MLTLYITPVIYLYLDRFTHWLARRRGPAPARMPEPAAVAK
jgi:hypothetical protein